MTEKSKDMTQLEVFDPIRYQIEKAAEAVKTQVFDYENPAGNKAARSLVAKVRKLKKPLHEAHKIAKADALAVCKALDERKREYLEQIENIIEVHAQPLREIEEREKQIAEDARKKAEEDAKREADARVREKIECADKAIREDEEDAKHEADAKEKADKAHREKIIGETATDINEILDDEAQARTIAQSIRRGFIRNVKMSF